jgi:nanoRNase/pAp phosphatase (c-di-AMP/oligoRNAs hydrolase)
MRKSEALTAVLDREKEVCILVHNNPDPDSLASASALAILFGKRGFRKVRIYYSGLIGRAENRELIKILPMKLQRASMIRKVRDRQFVLIDSQPYTGNVRLPEGGALLAAIDHHPLRKRTKDLPFYDVRPRVGACATIIHEYLEAEGIEIRRPVATALAYAIYSETQGLGREGTEEDRTAYVKLIGRVNFSRLSKILNPSLSRPFIANLSRVLLNTFQYKNFACVILEELPYPDFAAEMADFLLRIQNISWSLALGSYENQLSISIRTSQLKGHASRAIRRIIPRRGTSGGHEMIAGAQVPLEGLDAGEVQNLKRDIVRRMLEHLNHKTIRTVTRLVSEESFPLFEE